MSGPLNYIRNIQYATPPDMPAVGIVKGLKQLLQEARSMPTRREGLKFLQVSRCKSQKQASNFTL